MKKTSKTKKNYCKVLNREILKSRCVPEGYKCKSCSQYSKKIPLKRWDYVKQHLLYLTDGGHHNLYRWTFLVNDYILEELYKLHLDFESLQRNGMLEIQTVNEWEGLSVYVDGLPMLQSKIYKERFEKGNESAIFEFCQNHHFAFRSQWVVQQIEKWKLQRSGESLDKLKKLFNAFVNAKGKTLSTQFAALLKEDKEICDEIVELQKNGSSADQAIKKVSSQKNKGISTIKEIYYGYKADDSVKENLKRIKEDLRKKPTDMYIKKHKDALEKLVAKNINTGKSFSTTLDDDNFKEIRDKLIRLKHIPARGESFPEFIDPVIDGLFLHLDKIDSEYELYKKMRKLYQGVKFYATSPLLRKNIEKDPIKNLLSVIYELSEKTGTSENNLKEIYKTFRSLEINRNYDDEKNNKEDIINEELSV